MSGQIKPKQTAAVRAVRKASKMFSDQALVLDEIFNRAVEEAMPGNFSFHRDMRTALKAQAQYRATMKILLALEKERAAGKEKHQNSSKQTIENENSPA
jgi:predicted component of type VI protein secretion system